MKSECELISKIKKKKKFVEIQTHNEVIEGSPNNLFFLKNALKKTCEYFFKFLFLYGSTILPSR